MIGLATTFPLLLVRKGHADLYEPMLCHTQQRSLLEFGSVTVAFNDIAIIKPAVPPSNEVFLEVLDETAASGEPLATLTAINAVASTCASYDAKLSCKLLDVVSCSGVLPDPSPIGIDATFSAIVKKGVQSLEQQPHAQSLNVHVKDAYGASVNVKLVIACFRDLSHLRSYFASVIEVGTQRDDVKAGSADGYASDVGMPLERHLERNPESEGSRLPPSLT